MIKYIFLLLPFFCSGQFYKYATIYAGGNSSAMMTAQESYQYIDNQLVETTIDEGANYRYFVGVKKLSRFKFERKPKFYYDGNEKNASIHRSPVDKFEYLLQYEQIKNRGREYKSHDIWLRYVGNHTISKIQFSNNGYIDLSFNAIEFRFKRDFKRFRASLGGVVRNHPIYNLNPFKNDFPNADDFEAVATELGYVKEFYFIDANGNGYLDRLEQSFYRWILDGQVIAQNTAQFLQHYGTIPVDYNRRILSELGNQNTLSGVVGLSYYLHLDNFFILAYGNYFFINHKLTEYGSDTNDYDYGIIGNLKITKTLSLYSQVEYLSYFGRENHTINLGINYIIL